MVDYYDRILGAVGAILLAGVLVGLATAVPLQFAMAGSVLVATPFVLDGLFRNPPVETTAVGRATAAIVWHAALVWTLLSALL